LGELFPLLSREFQNLKKITTKSRKEENKNKKEEEHVRENNDRFPLFCI
jgi:hypothetical protein